MKRKSNTNSCLIRKYRAWKSLEQEADGWAEQHTEFSEQTKLNQKSQTSNL